MFVLVGATIAGMFLILRELFPWLSAQRTGVIHTRGHSRRKILRSEDPARFKRLLRNRTDGMVIGLLAIGIGIAWQIVGILSLFLLIPIGAVVTSQTRRATRERGEAQRLAVQDETAAVTQSETSGDAGKS